MLAEAKEPRSELARGMKLFAMQFDQTEIEKQMCIHKAAPVSVWPEEER